MPNTCGPPKAPIAEPCRCAEVRSKGIISFLGQKMPFHRNSTSKVKHLPPSENNLFLPGQICAAEAIILTSEYK